MSIKLSICIPTCNRAFCFRPVLQQLCSLVDRHPTSEEFEVCISDNGSDDGTWQMLREFETEYPFLAIRRNEVNQGFGKNLWDVAGMAKGEHLYFSGDDDLFRDEALGFLLSNTEPGADLVLVNSHPSDHQRKGDFVPGEIVALDSLERYLEKVGLFHGSFIGNLMFRREVFRLHSEIGDAVSRSAYPHLFPVFRTLREGKCVFVNHSITIPEDSSRIWRNMQPVYTSVDLARIVRQEMIPFIKNRVGWAVMLRLAQSLPRALFRVWTGSVDVDRKNPYQNIDLTNLLEVYLNTQRPTNRKNRH